MKFFIGLHQPSHARHFDECFISINRIRDRKSSFIANEWIMDSGAFTVISTHGDYLTSPSEYARHIERWSNNGTLIAAVSQYYMCEEFILKITGKTIVEHQSLTIGRYDELTSCDTGGVYVMPVLQGYNPSDYISHIRQYGDRLKEYAWVGVGSICKRNGSPSQIEDVILSIKEERPDLRLHGFGLKKTALSNGAITGSLYSADSMAWSFSARKQGRDANCWHEAKDFCERIKSMPLQYSFLPTIFMAER